MDAVEEVKSRLSIEDIIGEYVQLKRAGRNFKGLSPFTSERTPSFMVSPEKQIWHDFSSGKGGNMFSFVMEMEGLDFRGALEFLARKAGIDLSQYQTQRHGDNIKQKERLYELLEWTTKFYQVQFSRSQEALEYVFNKRRFTKETVLKFRLGYAPNTGDALVRFLQTKKFTPADMRAAGVSTQRYGRLQDMFRARLMVPLADPQGRVIGFTARLLADVKDAPKYINTPQTMLYDKSRHVYGLNLAKEAIRKNQHVVMVEGNLDVIASHQAGVRQVVATAGTALTEQHLKALSRFTGDIRLSFDADKAGIAATERAIPIASKVGVSLSVIDIPSGKDPDELIRQAGVEAWRTIIEKPKYALDWLIHRYQRQLDITTAQGKRQFSDVLLPIVHSLQDSVEQDHYLTDIASIIGISKEALVAKMHKTEASVKRPLKRRKTEVSPEQLDKAAIESIKVQDHLLGLALLHPPLREHLRLLQSHMLITHVARDLFVFLQTHPDFSGTAAELKELNQTKPEVQSLQDYVNILVLQYEELYQGLELIELQYEAARLQARLVEQYVKTEKQKLAIKLEDADEPTTRTLLEQVKQLDLLLKQAKGGTNGRGEDARY